MIRRALFETWCHVLIWILLALDVDDKMEMQVGEWCGRMDHHYYAFHFALRFTYGL
jgi:hypothetical protein